MDNRIRQIEIRDVSLIPAEAEVWITATPEQIAPTTELRGRFMGPHCHYASTVEVAYPLRSVPVERAPPLSNSLAMRAVIPEASLWEPESPFLYRSQIELWQDGQRCDSLMLHHGLRSIQIGERGLLVNGRSLRLQGQTLQTCSEDVARSLRQAGFNLLIAPLGSSAPTLWDIADRFGLLMLGRVFDDSGQTLRQMQILAEHASCLGWLIEEGKHPPLSLLPPGSLVGMSWDSPDREPPAEFVQFLFGPARLSRFGLPLLLSSDAPEPGAHSSAIGFVQR